MRINIPNIYFLHIPKTSGTSTYSSFHSVLEKSKYNEFLTWYHIAQQKNREVLIEDLYSSKLTFISGHFGWNEKITKGRFVFSMFRNPIYRTISQLQHIKRFPVGNAWVDGEFVVDEKELLSVLYEPELVKYVSNVQTKYLLSNIDPSKEILSLAQDTDYFWDQDPRLLNQLNSPSAVIVSKIVTRLLKLDFFGLNMLHPESIHMLSAKLKMSLPEIDTRNIKNNSTVGNIASESYPLSPESLVLLESINTYDSILYDFAKRVFIKRWMNYFNNKMNMKITFSEYIRDRKEYLRLLTS